jgi:hypothetical protein
MFTWRWIMKDEGLSALWSGAARQDGSDGIGGDLNEWGCAAGAVEISFLGFLSTRSASASATNGYCSSPTCSTRRNSDATRSQLYVALSFHPYSIRP